MKFEKIINDYPLQSDIVIMDSNYRFGSKNEENNTWNKDYMSILYKDNMTGKKHLEFIENPKYSYYILKKQYETPTYRKFFELENKLDQVVCKYNELGKSISREIGEEDKYKELLRNDKRHAMNLLQQNLRLYGSDININDFYRMRFGEQFKNTETHVTRSYLDIEVDNRLSNTPFPTKGNCPINAVSFMDHDTKELTTFLLNQSNINPQISEFMKTFDNDSWNIEFMEFLDGALGGKDKVKYFELDKLKTRVLMYNDERVLLSDLFSYINFKQPDFLLVWNMAFDIPFIIDRMIVLGMDPKEYICPKDIPNKYKFCRYWVDENKNDFAEKGDYADITSYTIYIDQLIQFASRRKGGAKFRSYSLDSIGDEVAGVRKLNYESIASKIADLPYNDYRTFVKYNMMDVLVQYCIEFKSDDIPYIFNKALLNATQYRKIHRQTVYLFNRAAMMFKRFGDYILGNNINKYKDHSHVETYEGAFVADPVKFADSSKDKINGKPIMRASNAVDFDFTRLYPSIIQEYNMAPNTDLGYIIIPNKIYDKENFINNPKYTRSGQFIEDLTSDNDLEAMHRWFHLANFMEMYKDIIEYFNTKEIPFYPIKDVILENTPIYDKNNNKLINAISIMSEEERKNINNIPIKLSEEKHRELDIKFKRKFLW